MNTEVQPIGWGGYIWSLAGILLLALFPAIAIWADGLLPPSYCALAGPQHELCTYGFRDWLSLLDDLSAFHWMLFMTIPLGIVLFVVWGVLLGLRIARHRRETAGDIQP